MSVTSFYLNTVGRGNMIPFVLPKGATPTGINTSIVDAAIIAISGSSSNKPLRERGMDRFTEHETNAPSIIKYVDHLVERKLCAPEQAAVLASTIPTSIDGELGCVYGEAWRTWPRTQELHMLIPHERSWEDLPSTFRKRVEADWVKVPEEVRSEFKDYKHWGQVVYCSCYDQLHEAILKLRGHHASVTIYNHNPAMDPLASLPAGVGCQVTGANFVPNDFCFRLYKSAFRSFGGEVTKTGLSCDVYCARKSHEDLAWFLPFYGTITHLVARELKLVVDTLSIYGDPVNGEGDPDVFPVSFEYTPEAADKDIYETNIYHFKFVSDPRPSQPD